MIYLIEDDTGIRELVLYTLQNTGREAQAFESVGAFRLNRQQNIREKAELLLLDIMLPGEDGIAFLKNIRANRVSNLGLLQDMPVILLTAKCAEYEKVHGLDCGADDYVVKPFGMMELVARVRAVLRRTQKDAEGNTEYYEFGTIKMDVAAHHISAAGKSFELTVKEFELLRYLLKHKGMVITRERLLDKVWGYEFAAETRTVDVHIRTLRQKLFEAGAESGPIETIRGKGYRISTE